MRFTTLIAAIAPMFSACCALTGAAPACGAVQVVQDDATIAIATPQYQVRIAKQGFRYSLHKADGTVVARPHPVCGLQFGGADAVETTYQPSGDGSPLVFEVINTQGGRATVRLDLDEHSLKFAVQSRQDQSQQDRSGPIVLRTAPVSPAFGLGDNGALGRDTTELTGFVEEELRALTGGSLGDLRGVARLTSSFVVHPRQGLALFNVEPGLKVVRITKEENAYGSSRAVELRGLYYFFGQPETLYREFRNAREREGYRVFTPKYEWFGLGWEAWGALAWETSQKTVTENVNRYLDSGYPLTWMVVGSGFWPRHDQRFHATTSFGMWDEKLYPDPRGMIEAFHQRGLKFIIGLRIAFITDGPFAAKGIARRAFIEEEGRPKVFKLAFPKSPCYLLDAHKPEAVEWYVGLCQKWLDYGIDGFKEDLYGYNKYVLPDDKIDPVNEALMDKGVYIMGRNGYVGSAMDIHRIEDFNFNQTQDRGPLNCLSLAYSGFAAPYPDLVGGTFTIKNMPPADSPRVKQYYMRKVRFASVTPVMAMGYGPWNMKDEQVERVALDAARLHARLQPYIYSAAVQAARTGFPHSFAPLALCFPKDDRVYELENTTRRGYQWMLGPSLLATPLYGDDYETAATRDVLLPAGEWMDWDTGKVYHGPMTLKDFAIPVQKTPLFVGGKGIIVELADRNQLLKVDTLQAVVFPVSPAGTRYVLIHPDGRSTSTISQTVRSWNPQRTRVLDNDGQSINFTVNSATRAIQFPIKPGVDYSVTAVE